MWSGRDGRGRKEGRKEERRKEEKDETSRHYTIGRLTVDSTEIYWLLFLVRAEGAVELVGGHKTGQLPVGSRKENEPLDIPSVPFDYNFGNAAFDSRPLLKF